MNARRHGSVTVASALIATLMLSSPALTAGPGGGGGGGESTGSLYADLVIALRDVNGTPKLVKYVVPETATTKAATEYCVQPVSYEEVPGLGAGQVNPVDGRMVWVLPLQGQWIPGPTEPQVLPVEFTGACDPQPQYAMFVSEVALERLNLVRTDPKVLADKLGDVEMKLQFADVIALQSTGRITFDGTTIDASPENAAIYQSLMTTGTIPGLPASPATIGLFDAWELAAVAIGAAASKGNPLNVDTVEYYNRISGLAAIDLWSDVRFVRSEDPDNAGTELDGSERFLDYSRVTYSRSETFKGSVTWLDVPTLTWKVDKILDVVPFKNLKLGGADGLTGVVAFAQLADDVRAMSNFIPDNTFIPGFYMDVPGVDTWDAQLAAITGTTVALGTLPENVFPTVPFTVTASLHSGSTETVGLRLTHDGDLVDSWGPFPVKPGYNLSTTFDVTVATAGLHDLTLELVDSGGGVLATDTGTITVNDKVATVLWGDPIPKFTTQGTWATIPLRVYSPDVVSGLLTLTVAGPAPLAAGNVTVYGVRADAMVAMPLTLADGSLSGTWDVALGAGYTDVTWYASVAVGAPVGDYTFGVSLEGGNTLALPTVIVVFAPEEHGGTVPDTVLPVVTITPVGTPGATATFNFTVVDANLATVECRLTKDGTPMTGEDWAVCTSPKAYTGLSEGAYVFSVRGTDKALNVATASSPWTVAPAPDTTKPVVTITPVGIPASSATFTITVVDASLTTIECRLTKNDTAGAWAACTSPKTYTGLKPATYLFSARATDSAGNISDVASSVPWTVKKGGGG